MKTLASVLTVLVAILLTSALPAAEFAGCCMPKPCCAAGACQCHMTVPTTPTSADMPATVPVPLPQISHALLPAVVSVTVTLRTLAVEVETVTPPGNGDLPLFALTHAYLI